MTMKEAFESDKEIRIELIEASKDIGRTQLRDRFKKLDHEKNVKKVHLKWYAVAASIALVMATIFLMRSPSPDQLYAENYTKFPNKIAAITRSNSGIEVLKNIMIAYESGQYEGLITKIQEHEVSFPQLIIYKAMVLLELEEFEMAVDNLKVLHMDSAKPFHEDASWYLALSYLKMEKSEEAKNILKGLIARSDHYTSRARNLLDEL